MKTPLKLSFLAILILAGIWVGRANAASPHTFATFNAGTITGGGPAFTKSLDVSGLPNSEYLFVRVTANYQSAPAPHDGYSSTLRMELSDGGTAVFWPTNAATVGAVSGDSTNTLTWYGMFPTNSYLGGTNLVIQFADYYTDASGPYYSTVSNVSVTLYPAPTPKVTFTNFNVGTLTGGGAAFTKSLAVSGLPNSEYLFVRVKADYQSAPAPHDGYSSTLRMGLSDGGAAVFWPTNTATVGAVAGDSTNTLTWYGMFPTNSYFGGTNLVIQFADYYTDASGPYYSTVSNVSVTLYPAPTPKVTFTNFNVGTLTGGGAAFTKSLAASGLPGSEYLFARVKADYQSAPAPHDGYSSTLRMGLNDGGTAVFWPTNTATMGVVAADSTNTLAWYGMFPTNSYLGGTNLVIQFADYYTDASGPYYSTVSNVTVTLYPAVSSSLGSPQLDITRSGVNMILTWTNNVTGFTLQSTTNLVSPAAWTPVSPAPTVINGLNTVTNPIAGTQTFYRLGQ